jgi:LuxR family maltose regulon positive regulatory protein
MCARNWGLGTALKRQCVPGNWGWLKPVRGRCDRYSADQATHPSVTVEFRASTALDCQEARLTLISAPAGYGKTTLVTEWLLSLTSAGEEVKVAWLSLDEGDNDPQRFLAYLLAALRQINAGFGSAVEAMLQSPQPPPGDVILTALVNEIAAVLQPFILILDDYHVVHTPPIYQQLSFLLEHRPPQMRLVILTREDPPLPLARLRARGQMVEIRQEDLRFSRAECADFLNQVMGLNLPPADIAALERRTEGWIAGLQLAALSMRGRDDLPGFIETFTGSSHYVLDYLIEEVFRQQPADVQDFLLRTSILDRLSGPLCDIVAHRMDSRDLLEHLEHANLFIIPLDQSCTWYRYHHLFAELLRQRLRTGGTFSEIELHHLASQWFQVEGLFPEAIKHALAACDWDRAAGLIQDISVRLLGRGELMTLLGWLKSLPAEAVFVRPELCRDYGWALTLTGQLDAADAYLRQAEAVAHDSGPLLGTVLVARAYNLRVRGGTAQAIEYARRALGILPQADALSRSLAALTLGLAYWTRGDFQESERAFMEVDRAAQQSGNQYARMTALAYLAMTQAVYGRLHRAAELCRQVIQLGGQSPPVAPAHIELGALFYEWNDLDAAAEQVHIGIEQSQRTGNPLIESDGYRTLAVIQQGRGEPEAAQATLQKADQLAESHQVSPLTCIRNAACHVQIALAQGDLAAAQFWAERVTEPTDTSLLYSYLGLTPIRILLARHEKTEAAKRLKELYETATQKGCGAGMVEVLTWQALAADAPGDALHFLQEGLKRAQPEGFIRTFVDKGESMKALLERLKSQGGELKPYILTLLAAFGETGETPKAQQLVEPMSERELGILRLLADGLSNREIAEKLVISVGTTKSHVHHILDKLGSDSRAQAVAKARELGLL